MARLTPDDARRIARDHNIPLAEDFHALSSNAVERINAAADLRGYRKPANANGSRARYFHALLSRTAARKD